MGVVKYISLIPYLKVDGEIISTKIMIKRLCVDHPNLKQDLAKFCGQCGKEIQSIDYPVSERLNAMQILRRHENYIEDTLYSPEYLDVIISNTIPPNSYNITDADVAIDLKDKTDKINNEIEWFKNKFHIEIEILNNAFGRENVHVCWGLVSYWS